MLPKRSGNRFGQQKKGNGTNSATSSYNQLQTATISYKGMSTTNMRIERTCEYCKNSFIAQKVTTRYCSNLCNSRDYKKRMREKKIGIVIEEDSYKNKGFDPIIKEKEFLSIKEVCMLLGASRWTVYRMIDSGQVKAVKIGWKTIIERNEINKLFLYTRRCKSL